MHGATKDKWAEDIAKAGEGIRPIASQGWARNVPLPPGGVVPRFHPQKAKQRVHILHEKEMRT